MWWELTQSHWLFILTVTLWTCCVIGGQRWVAQCFVIWYNNSQRKRCSILIYLCLSITEQSTGKKIWIMDWKLLWMSCPHQPNTVTLFLSGKHLFISIHLLCMFQMYQHRQLENFMLWKPRKAMNNFSPPMFILTCFIFVTNKQLLSVSTVIYQ